MLKTDAFVKLVKLMKRYGGVLSSSVCHLSMAPLFFFMFPQLDSVPSICARLAYYKEERGVLQ